MTKRSYIRIVSYIGFMLAVIVISSVMSATNMKAYKTELEVSYQQSLAEFAECLDKVDTDITKSLVSNSKGEVYDLSRDLYAQCSTAKNAMSRLPRDEKSRTFSSNSKRSHILRTSSRSRRLILSSIVSLAVSLKCTRTI